MAQLSATLYTSHVPAIGAAMDLARDGDAYWKPVFDGYAATRQWLAANTPDVVVMVYNDHATAMDYSVVPPFAIGVSDHFEIADEGWGRRPVPDPLGHPALARHLVHRLMASGFDMTVLHRPKVDHGLSVPLSLGFGRVSAWPCRVIPLMVNVVHAPLPTAARCLALGQALGEAIRSYGEDLNVQVWGTGGMSHQLQGPRSGFINSGFDRWFLDQIVHHPTALTELSHEAFVAQAGTEGAELVMWLVARGAQMAFQAEGDRFDELQRHYHVPASNTAVGHLLLAHRALATA
ncbi:class III extradiol dioxygenase subunit beta [Hydrogenophaga sp. 2FB]|uniref:class III extradiol dioxygenase subunit beta n=1 Tax=Hydrogenophaga sp. 2FB TaxID=2502187 RepID=UPI0010F8CEE0|nr:class III extradiol dioxygenase subunit beta [Hydrogenophaga sp. 2FB]